MPPRITKESHRPRVSDRTMRYRVSERITVMLGCFKKWRRHDSQMKPQTGRISTFHSTKRSNDFLTNATRRSEVHVRTIGLNAETKKCRHRAAGEICLLTFPFIGHLRLGRLPGLDCAHAFFLLRCPLGNDFEYTNSESLAEAHCIRCGLYGRRCGPVVWRPGPTLAVTPFTRILGVLPAG